MKVNYVLGLAFSKTKNQMVAILKDRPEFQKGKWNGIGGKIEPKDGDSLSVALDLEVIIKRAIKREFTEETGAKTSIHDWDYFAKLTIQKDALGGVAVIHCLRLFDNGVFECETQESEKIEIHTVSDLMNKLPVAPNLPMLISIALNQSVNFVEIQIETQK